MLNVKNNWECVLCMKIMVIWVVNFSRECTKLDRFLSKNHYTQRKLLYFVNWHTVASCQKLSKSEFQSLFSKSKINGIFLIFFHLWIHITLGANFLITSIFETLNHLKWCPIFDDSPPHQFTKYNNFFRGYFFLAINLIYLNFVSFPWKLDNPYYHNENAFAKTLVWNNRWTFKNKLSF